TFASLSTSASFSLTPTDDNISEGDETVMLQLSSPSSATMGANDDQVFTITDDEGLPTLRFSLDTDSVAEATTPTLISVELSNPSSTTVTVDYNVTGGSATGGGVDYTLGAGVITFSPGQTSRNISVTINNDLIDEASEDIEVTLSNETANATLDAAHDVHTLE